LGDEKGGEVHDLRGGEEVGGGRERDTLWHFVSSEGDGGFWSGEGGNVPSGMQYRQRRLQRSVMLMRR
jgi:hypothetical protein